jgi:predicted PurR-regulated permease PerM
MPARLPRKPNPGKKNQLGVTGARPGDTPRQPNARSATPDASDLVPETAERLLFGLLLLGSGLFLLALLAAFYIAAAIVLPVALAFVLMLVLRPALRMSERWHVPRIVAALLLIVLLFAVAAGLASVLAAPAAGWVQNLPAALPRLPQRLRFLGEPIPKTPASWPPSAGRSQNDAPPPAGLPPSI